MDTLQALLNMWQMDINVSNSTGGAHKADFLALGPGSERPVRFIWHDFQAKPAVLDLVGTKFDAFGQDRNFGRDLTSPVLLCSLAAGAFFSENDHPWI